MVYLCAYISAIITSIWGIMGCTVVAAAPSGEGKARLEPVFADEAPGRRLQLLADLDHRHTGFYIVSDVFPSLQN